MLQDFRQFFPVLKIFLNILNSFNFFLISTNMSFLKRQEELHGLVFNQKSQF